MAHTRRPRIDVYVSTLDPQGIGIAKAILSATPELRALGFEVILKQADFASSVRDAALWAARGAHAILYDGIGLGFRYGSLINMLTSSMLTRRVFLIWHEDAWVYRRLMLERPRRGMVFNMLMRGRRLRHLVISERAKRFGMSLGIPEDRIHVIGGCLSPPDETARLTPVFPSDDRMRVVAVGSIQARKGTDLFCEAAINVCKRVSHVDFYWIGRTLTFEPGFYDACLERVRESGFEDRIKFCGFVERTDIYLAQCDLFVLPSRDEPLGLSALEAMAFSKLVIMFDVGGLAELMGEYGMVLGEPSAERLADKIVELSTGSKEHLVREDARHRVLDYFSPRQYAQRLASAMRSGPVF